MIDWLTVRVWVAARVEAGQVVCIDADGVIEWRCERRQEIPGSYSAQVTVRRNGFDGTLEISGNPAKWFQGHNVFGTDDLRGVSQAFVEAVCARLDHSLDEEERGRIREGIIVISRIDVTESWDFGTRPRALSAVAALGHCSHLSHRGRGSLVAEGTCIWGKGSRRWNGKAYSKGLELTKHRLHPELPQAAAIETVAQGLVRFEFTVRAMELKRRGLDMVCNWSKVGVTPGALHAELMSQLTISDAAMIDTHQLDELPLRLCLIYDAWKAGKDLRALLPRRTFYRHRTALLAFGIDIASVQPHQASNVVPLRVILTGQRFEVPSWSIGTSLYFEPKAA